MLISWQFHLGFIPPWPVLVALVLTLGLAAFELVAAILAKRKDPSPTRPSARLWSKRKPPSIQLAALRLLALGVLAALLFELGVEQQDETALRSRLAVLFDNSASMSTRADPNGVVTALNPDSTTAAPPHASRRQRAAAHWRQSSNLLTHWREAGLAPDLYRFGAQLDPFEPTADSSAAGESDEFPFASASRLGSALTRLQDLGRKRTTPLSSLLIYSDGLVAIDEAAREALLEDGRTLGVPINAVFCAEEHLRDLSVGELSVGEFAFVENLTTVEAKLYAFSLTGEEVEIELLREGESIASQRLRLDDRDEYDISFEFAPETVGQQAYEIYAHPVSGEASLANNRRAFVMKVLRDKIRVLHVAGRPDWDVRSLRTLMRRDPNVELLSYYILRDEEDTLRDDADAPMSLIAFPTQELFHEQLGSFDLIILHNFDAMTHGDYLGNLARYVQEGGSLVLIGGDLGLATGDYANSPLAPYLPVVISLGLALDQAPFFPTLSPEGARHPITSWLASAGSRDKDPSDARPESSGAKPASGSKGLVQLDSFNPATLRREGDAPGQALLLGPRGAPLLSVAEPGKGRTLVLATGASWRLGFAPDLELIDGARPYDLLWLGVIRWALRDNSADRLTVQSDQVSYAPGQSVTLSARTTSSSYQPEAGVELLWSLRQLGGTLAPPVTSSPPATGEDKADRAETAPRNFLTRRGEWSTDELGRASQTIDGLPEGAYAIEVSRMEADTSAEQQGAPMHDSARRVFVVSAGGSELARLEAKPGRELLRELSAASGGVFVEDCRSALPTDLPAQARAGSGHARMRQSPLWSSWPFMLLVLGLLGLEWYLRRRAGLR